MAAGQLQLLKTGPNAGKARKATNYEYGVKAEYNCRDTLRAQNFSVMRAAASQGVFDLIGIRADSVVCVQVKRGAKPSPCEYKTAIEQLVPPGVINLVVWYPANSMEAPCVLYCADSTGPVPLPAWCPSARWLDGPPPKQPKLRGI